MENNYSEELVNFVSNIKVGGANYSLQLLTIPTFKGGKANAYTGRVKKATWIDTAKNNAYSKHIANVAKKKGKSEEEIKLILKDIDDGNYDHVSGALFKLKSNPAKLYIRCNHFDEKTPTAYYLDGEMVTDKAIENDIKANLSGSYDKGNPKLDALGVPKEKQIKVRYAKLEGVTYIKCKSVWGEKNEDLKFKTTAE